MSELTYERELIYDRITPSLRSSVGVVRRELDAELSQLGAVKALRDDVALVVTEAAANVVVHAYEEGRPGPVYVAATLGRHALVVAVCDAGFGVRPDLESRGAGLGFPLMGQLCD